MTFLSWHLPSTGRCHCPGGICIKKLVCHARWWLLLCWGHSNKKFCGFSCRIFFGWLGTKYLFMSSINSVSTSVMTEASFLFLVQVWTDCRYSMLFGKFFCGCWTLLIFRDELHFAETIWVATHFLKISSFSDFNPDFLKYKFSCPILV